MKLLISLMVVLFVAILPLTGSCAVPPPLTLGNDLSYQLAGYLEQLVDPGGTLTLIDVLSPAVASRFSPLQGNMNRGYTRDTVWLRFRINRSPQFPEQSYLSLGPQYLDAVEVYLQCGENMADPAAYRKDVVGDHVPAAELAVRSTSYLIPLFLQANHPRTVYLKVKTTSSVVLVGSINAPADAISHNERQILFNGGYLAIILFISLINFIFFLRLRDRLYLSFAFLIMSLFISQIAPVGILALLLPGQAHLLSDYTTGWGTGMTMCGYALFGRRLFPSTGAWTRRVLTCTIVLGCLTMLSVPLGFYGSVVSALFIGTLATITLLTCHSVKAAQRREPGGMLYLAAFGTGNIGYISQILRLLGIMPAYWWTMQCVQVSNLANMVLMTLALTERLHAAEEKALTAAREAKQKAVELAGEMTVELREEREKLKEALERQIRFVDMVSHEYRTPLAILKTNLDLLRDGKEEGFDRTLPISLMQRAVARLVEVVESSLGVSRLAEPNTGVDNRERIEVADFLSEIREEARNLWATPPLTLPPARTALTFVLADRSQLKTAIFNLIDNADKYGPAGGRIDLSMESDGNLIGISVADQGPGISVEEQTDIRLKFKRGSAGVGRAGGGIGLYLVERIVAEHGGRVDMRLNSPQGTIVTIYLPPCA